MVPTINYSRCHKHLTLVILSLGAQLITIKTTKKSEKLSCKINLQSFL